MALVFQDFVQYERELGAFGAIAVKIFAGVFKLFKGLAEAGFGFLYLAAYLRQVCQLQGSAIFVNNALQGYIVEKKLVVFYIETLLREIEGLVNEVAIGVVHLSVKRKKGNKR